MSLNTAVTRGKMYTPFVDCAGVRVYYARHCSTKKILAYKPGTQHDNSTTKVLNTCKNVFGVSDNYIVSPGERDQS